MDIPDKIDRNASQPRISKVPLLFIVAGVLFLVAAAVDLSKEFPWNSLTHGPHWMRGLIYLAIGIFSALLGWGLWSRERKIA